MFNIVGYEPVSGSCTAADLFHNLSGASNQLARQANPNALAVFWLMKI